MHTRECRFPDIFAFLIDGSLTFVVGSQDLADMPDHARKEVAEFFNTYRNLEGSDIWARVSGAFMV